jgi:type II secretory pathway component PulF
MSSPNAFYRSLASLHGAGVAWPMAVESASGGDRRWARARDALMEGSSVAEAFRPVVDPLDLAILQAGERDGSLHRSLTTLADLHEARGRHRSLRRTAIVYPFFLAHLAAVLLPLPDVFAGRWLDGLGWSALVLLPVYAILLLYRVAERPRTAPEDVDSGEPPAPSPLRGPWRSSVETADARAMEAFGHLLEAGVPLLDATRLAMRPGWGGRAARDLARVKRAAERGTPMGPCWQELPPELAQRLRSAEEAGDLGRACLDVARELRFRVETRQTRGMAVLPALLLLVVGGVIALRVLSFYAAYFGRVAGG